MKEYIVYVERKVKVSYIVQANSEKEAKELYYEGKAGEGTEYDYEDQDVDVEEYDG